MDESLLASDPTQDRSERSILGIRHPWLLIVEIKEYRVHIQQKDGLARASYPVLNH
jgi:hypothetical protein